MVAATGTGKTVVAALDYRRLRADAQRDLSQLFVAHRERILEQSRATFRAVLRDGSFGELHGRAARARRRPLGEQPDCRHRRAARRGLLRRKRKVAPPNEPSYDVLAADGRRLQVKALRRSQKGRTTLSPLRGHDFDAVVAVTFKPDLEVEAAFYIPLAVVEEYERWSETWKAHRLSLTKRLCADDRVTRIGAGDLIGENDR